MTAMTERLTRDQVPPMPPGAAPTPTYRGNAVLDVGDERWRIDIASGEIITYIEYLPKPWPTERQGQGSVDRTEDYHSVEAVLRRAWHMTGMTLVVRLEPAVVRGAPYPVDYGPGSWVGARPYRSDWIDAEVQAKRIWRYTGPSFDVPEIMFPGIHTRAPGQVWDGERWVDPPPAKAPPPAKTPFTFAAELFKSGAAFLADMPYRCTEVYDGGIRHPDGRWEPKAKRRYLPIRFGSAP